jgi:hypothetical protein
VRNGRSVRRNLIRSGQAGATLTDMASPGRRTGNRRAWKYGGGVSTPTLAGRIALTLCSLALGAMLASKVIRESEQSHFTVVVTFFVLFALWLFATVVFFHDLWRPSAEWKTKRFEALRLERRLRHALSPDQPMNPALLRAKSARCPVCDQAGPTLVPARSRCSACGRPWSATKALAVIDLREPASAPR